MLNSPVRRADRRRGDGARCQESR